MKRNVLYNELGPQDPIEVAGPEGQDFGSSSVPKRPFLGKVRVNEGDAWSVICRIFCAAIHHLQFTHVCTSC